MYDAGTPCAEKRTCLGTGCSSDVPSSISSGVKESSSRRMRFATLRT
jgi:hypothetical protein